MTTRDQIVRTALGFNGTCDGQGYDGPNPFSAAGSVRGGCTATLNR